MGPISQLDAIIRDDVIGSLGGGTGLGGGGGEPGSGDGLGVAGGEGSGEPEPLLPPQLWAESISATVMMVRTRRAGLYFNNTSTTQDCVRSSVSYCKVNRVQFDSFW